MRFIVSYEENNSQNRDGHCHPQKRQLQPPSHHSQISFSPSHGCPSLTNVALCFYSGGAKERRGSGRGPCKTPKTGTFPTRRGVVVTSGHEGWCSLFARVVKVTEFGLLWLQRLLD